MSDAHDIKLIIFDAGGVMVRICHGGLPQACQEANIEIPSAASDPNVTEQLALLSQGFETGQLSTAMFVEQTAKVTGLAKPQIESVMHHWLIAPYPGIGTFIGKVRAACAIKDITTAVLSNTNPPHWQLMKTDSHAAIPVRQLQHQFLSFEIGVMKPDAGIYKHVEHATRIDPKQILFFDDALPNIESAQSRGWRALRIDHHGNPIEQMTKCLVEYGVF